MELNLIQTAGCASNAPHASDSGVLYGTQHPPRQQTRPRTRNTWGLSPTYLKYNEPGSRKTQPLVDSLHRRGAVRDARAPELTSSATLAMEPPLSGLRRNHNPVVSPCRVTARPPHGDVAAGLPKDVRFSGGGKPRNASHLLSGFSSRGRPERHRLSGRNKVGRTIRVSTSKRFDGDTRIGRPLQLANLCVGATLLLNRLELRCANEQRVSRSA